MSAFVLCHWCGDRLPLKGRDVATVYPCCGDKDCERARKRAYEAARRVRQRSKGDER